jgi:hypothetical protein
MRRNIVPSPSWRRLRTTGGTPVHTSNASDGRAGRAALVKNPATTKALKPTISAVAPGRWSTTSATAHMTAAASAAIRAHHASPREAQEPGATSLTGIDRRP